MYYIKIITKINHKKLGIKNNAQSITGNKGNFKKPLLPTGITQSILTRDNWQKHGRSEKWIQQRMMGQE